MKLQKRCSSSEIQTKKRKHVLSPSQESLTFPVGNRETDLLSEAASSFFIRPQKSNLNQCSTLIYEYGHFTVGLSLDFHFFVLAYIHPWPWFWYHQYPRKQQQSIHAYIHMQRERERVPFDMLQGELEMQIKTSFHVIYETFE